MENFNTILTQPFYNTIRLTEDQWQDENKKAFALMQVIQNIYEANPRTEISGWQVHDFLEATLNKKINILSVRRSISNLKKSDTLIKTTIMRVGDEGKPEHLYIWTKGNEHRKEEKPTGKTLVQIVTAMAPGKQAKLNL